MAVCLLLASWSLFRYYPTLLCFQPVSSGFPSVSCPLSELSFTYYFIPPIFAVIPLALLASSIHHILDRFVSPDFWFPIKL